MCMMSDGQMSTHSPQPSQRVIYTKVGISYSSISYRKLVKTALVVVGSFSLDAKPHVRRVLAHILGHIRKLALYFRIRQIIVRRQILPRTIGTGDFFLVGRSGLEEHMGELGKINAAK